MDPLLPMDTTKFIITIILFSQFIVEALRMKELQIHMKDFILLGENKKDVETPIYFIDRQHVWATATKDVHII